MSVDIPQGKTAQRDKPLTRADVESFLQKAGSSDKLNLHGRNMTGIDLRKIKLREANLIAVDLTGAYLTEVDLTETNLTNKQNDMLHLSEDEVKKLKGSVERTISEARKVMQDLQTPA